MTAARLKAEYPACPADAVIAAFAIRRAPVLMHKNPELEALRGLIRIEALPYKSFGD